MEYITAWNILENLLKNNNTMFVVKEPIDSFREKFVNVVGLEINTYYIGNNVYRVELKVIK